jgi:cobalt-zinc-cadmium efflux system outer membrane protein
VSDPSLLPGERWTLAKLVDLAVQNHPDLAAARARVQAAQGRLIQAGLYPNPQVWLRMNEIGARANAAGELGPTFVQEIVTAKKLRLAQGAAAHGVDAADWQAITRWYDVVTRVRQAYFEVLTAHREVKTLEEVVRLSEEGLQVAEKLLKAGAGSQPDVLRAKVELDQNKIRKGVADRRAEASWRLLAAALGQTSLAGAHLDGHLEKLAVPLLDWQPLLAQVLERSSEVQEAQAMVLQAEQLVRRAAVEKVPNVHLMVMPFYSFSDHQARGQVNMGWNVPVFNRNQGNVLEAQANLARSHAEVGQVELRLTERLTAAFQRYRAAREQTEAYSKQILPNARESLRLVRLGYERGDPKYDYTAVLQAQHTLVQAQLTYVQALGELWRALADVAGLVQQDSLFEGLR